MRLRSTLPVLAVLLMLCGISRPPWSLTAAVGSSNLVISQVYGGGGNSGAPYSNKFVELFNRGATATSLVGRSIQYASATGTGNFSTSVVVLPEATVLPGGYFLIQLAGGANGAPLPAPDAIGTFNPAATAGKVILAATPTGLTCNGGSNPCTSTQLADIVDLVGYGLSNFYEGSGPAPILSATTAATRSEAGCADTNDNAADFKALAPVPRNSSSAPRPCAPPEPSPVATPQITPEPTPDITPEPTPDITPEPTPDITPEITPEPTPDITPEPTPDITPEPTPDITPEITAEPTPEITPDPTHEITPEPTPEITPEPTPDITPEITPEPTPIPSFAFDGFAPPVSNLPSLNSVRAGSAVPIKFSLGGDFGLDVIVGGWPSSRRHSCSGTESVEVLEATSTAGASGLDYDALSDSYIYVWKTDRAWVGTCRTFVLELVDGTSHSAEFAFR